MKRRSFLKKIVTVISGIAMLPILELVTPRKDLLDGLVFWYQPTGKGRWRNVIRSFDGEMYNIYIAKRDGFAIKMINGEPWHLSWSTNAFEDRQKEIFTTKALENYVSEAEKKSDRGYFNFWHIPGTDFAKKEFQNGKRYDNDKKNIGSRNDYGKF